MAAPLRKILRREKRLIGTSWTGRPIEIEREVLECGHKVEPKKDIYGETNAYRRRCVWCLRQEMSTGGNGEGGPGTGGRSQQ